MSLTAAAVDTADTADSDRAPAEAFFLPAMPGQRFCLYHPPRQDRPCRGAFIYIHPFAEEMNRSRHMAAMQARRLADLGYGVLAIDLFGCGDSSGDFGDAGWDDWKADLALARRWLRDRIPAHSTIGLWGLRLGALLALDFLNDRALNPDPAGADRIAALVLWSPVVSGKSFMTQFLRLRLGSDMLADNAGKLSDNGTAAAPGTKAMREALHAGATLEIAGYHLAPALALPIDALDAALLPPLSSVPPMQVHWFDLVRNAASPTPPPAAAALAAWRECMPASHLHCVKVVGAPFWATPELSLCPDLLESTVAAFDDAPAASTISAAAAASAKSL